MGKLDHEELAKIQPFIGKQFGTAVVWVCVAVLVKVVVVYVVIGGGVGVVREAKYVRLWVLCTEE